MSEVKTNKISSVSTNGDITLDPDGTGDVVVASGNVGIGTTSPQELLHINDSSSPVIRLTNSTTGTGSGDGSEIMIGDADKTLRIINHEDSNVRIDVNGSEAARFTSGGSFLVGSTDPSNRKMVVESTQTGSFVADIRTTDTSNYDGRVLMVGSHRNTTNGTYDHISCTIHGEADKLRIKDSGQVQNANGSYTTLSDARMKENIIDASSQWDDIKAIQLRNFNMIGDDLTQLGVVAQELEASGMTGLVGESDWYDETANPNNEKRKYVKQSILYMKALGALQEAITKIETLETEMTALKARVTALEDA